MLRILAILSLLAAPSGARELHVLAGAGMAPAVRKLAAGFGARNGVAVSVVGDTTGGVRKRLEGGETYDLVIATDTALEALAQEARVAPQHHDLARLVAGIAVKKDQPAPVLPDAGALRNLLRTAPSIAYVDPARGGITGVFFLALADRLGVGSQVRAHAVLEQDGAAVAAAVAGGQARYGVTLVSEMLPDKDVRVTPLPDDAQMTTLYAAALATGAANPLDAARLIDTLTGEEGRTAARDAGLKPVSPFN